MIEISHIVRPSKEQVVFAIEGMRNPMNSWDRSDTQGTAVGSNDRGLMLTLVKGGTEHRKFMRQLPVSMRITAPLYFWKEFDTYKVGTTANSCSTMHKIAEHEFTLKDFSCEHLTCDGTLNCLKVTIQGMNIYRDLYLEESDPDKKKLYWWQMIQLLPSSYNQTRNVSMNYETLSNIYRQRRGHKLDEWKKFCETAETQIPYSFLVTGKEDN